MALELKGPRLIQILHSGSIISLHIQNTGDQVILIADHLKCGVEPELLHSGLRFQMLEDD